MPISDNWMGTHNEVTETNTAPWLNRIRRNAYGLNWWATTDHEMKIKLNK